MLKRAGHIAVLAALCLLLGVAVSACGSSGTSSGGETTGGGGGKTAPDVALLLNSHSDFQTAYEKGLEASLKPAGGSFTSFVSNFDPTKESSQCQAAIQSGRYNAIVVEPISGPTSVPCATEANEAGIPVISLEDGVGSEDQALEPTVPGVVGQIVIVESEAIKQQVSMVEQACKGIDPCTILAEIASASDGATNNPLKAIEQQLPNAKIVGKFATNYDPAAVVKAMPEELSAHPEANVYFSIADSSATAALPIIKEVGMLKQLKTIAYGGSVQGAQAISNGEIFATLALFPISMGETAAEMATAAVNGEEIEHPGVNANLLGKPPVVTAANVDQFKPQWGASTGGG